MESMTAATILAAFTRRQRRYVVLPDLGGVDWERLDYLGWAHASGHMAYVVYNHERPAVGLVLRRTKLTGAQRPKLCSWCLTTHQGCGVNLFTAQIGDNAARVHGDYVCNDLRCSAYVRGLLRTGVGQMRETITVGERVARLRTNVERFIRSVYGEGAQV
ncbi:FBP C-terminal treble-clef zinc-finger [Humidesulfovibrio mexicanus]|uniref:FBP C-terminal treble-clef zinc-finger n=2 Tax=Humidesulfovibrio mexicanus TaxID=147047 RepID=A0A239CFX9_9BACT|nr:FBP C-terminal treble-clef zinc-finger [Humidesulfovibrio mexicanus]